MNNEGVVFLIPKEYANNKRFMALIRRLIEGLIAMCEANKELSGHISLITDITDKGGPH